MRPTRFLTYLGTLTTSTPLNDTRYPYGITLTSPHGPTHWQIMGQLADGERHEHDDTPTHDQPPTAPEQPGNTPASWLAHLIADDKNTEINAIEPWTRQSGITIRFHNGSRIYARQL